MRENQEKGRREKKVAHGTEWFGKVFMNWVFEHGMSDWICWSAYEILLKSTVNLNITKNQAKPSQARIWPQYTILHLWYYAHIEGYVVVFILSDHNARTFICRKNFYILTEWHVAKFNFTWIFLNKVRNPIDSTTSISFFSLCA